MKKERKPMPTRGADASVTNTGGRASVMEPGRRRLILEMVAPGKRARERREQFNLTQDFVAAWLGISQRTLSYFETGRARLTPLQIKRLESRFDSTERGEHIPDIRPLNLLREDEFISIQQTALNQGEWRDFWFSGIRSLPVLKDGDYQAVWIKNLQAGINYRLLWTLHQDDKNLFQLVQNTLSRIAQSVPELASQSGGKAFGRIFVYGITIGPASADIAPVFDQLKNHFTNHFPAVVTVHATQDLADVKFVSCRPILQFGWQRSVVAYLDKRSVHSFAATFLEGISNDPKGEESGWTFLSPSAQAELIVQIEEFHRRVPDLP